MALNKRASKLMSFPRHWEHMVNSSNFFTFQSNSFLNLDVPGWEHYNIFMYYYIICSNTRESLLIQILLLDFMVNFSDHPFNLCYRLFRSETIWRLYQVKHWVKAETCNQWREFKILFNSHRRCATNSPYQEKPFEDWPKAKIAARNRPCGSASFLPLVTSSVVVIKDNFVR